MKEREEGRWRHDKRRSEEERKGETKFKRKRRKIRVKVKKGAISGPQNLELKANLHNGDHKTIML